MQTSTTPTRIIMDVGKFKAWYYEHMRNVRYTTTNFLATNVQFTLICNQIMDRLSNGDTLGSLMDDSFPNFELLGYKFTSENRKRVQDGARYVAFQIYYELKRNGILDETGRPRYICNQILGDLMILDYIPY